MKTFHKYLEENRQALNTDVDKGNMQANVAKTLQSFRNEIRIDERI